MSKRLELPLDDPRRMPLTYLHKWLSEHTTGDDYLAAADNERGAREQAADAMHALGHGEHRKHVPAAFWTDHEFYQDLMRWVVGPRNPRALTIPLTNWAFYVWEPDAAKRWPALEQPADGASDAKPVKPGPKPRGNWPTLIQQWLLAVAADDPERLHNVDGLVIEAQAFLQDRLNWAPSDTKGLRAKIAEQLKLVRR